MPRAAKLSGSNLSWMAAATACLDAEEGKQSEVHRTESSKSASGRGMMPTRTFVAPVLNARRPPQRTSDIATSNFEGSDDRPQWMIAAADRVDDGKRKNERSHKPAGLSSPVSEKTDKSEEKHLNSFSRGRGSSGRIPNEVRRVAEEGKDADAKQDTRPAWMIAAAERLEQEEQKMKAAKSVQRKEKRGGGAKLSEPSRSPAQETPACNSALLPVVPDEATSSRHGSPNESSLATPDSLLAPRQARNFLQIFSSETSGETTTVIADPIDMSRSMTDSKLSAETQTDTKEWPGEEELNSMLKLREGESAQRESNLRALVAAAHKKMRASCEHAVSNLNPSTTAFLTDVGPSSPGRDLSDSDDENELHYSESKASTSEFRNELDALFSTLASLRSDVADAKEEHRRTITEGHRLNFGGDTRK